MKLTVCSAQKNVTLPNWGGNYLSVQVFRTGYRINGAPDFPLSQEGPLRQPCHVRGGGACDSPGLPNITVQVLQYYRNRGFKSGGAKLRESVF